MRRRYVQIDGELVEYGNASQERVAPDVMPDIAPYQSMITGEMISSRSRHREHLRDHGYTEIGNDSILNKPYTGMPDTAPAQRKELLRSQVDAMTHEQFKAAGKRDLERLRWNTRGIPDPLKEI